MQKHALASENDIHMAVALVIAKYYDYSITATVLAVKYDRSDFLPESSVRWELLYVVSLTWRR